MSVTPWRVTLPAYTPYFLKGDDKSAWPDMFMDDLGEIGADEHGLSPQDAAMMTVSFALKTNILEATLPRSISEQDVVKKLMRKVEEWMPRERAEEVRKDDAVAVRDDLASVVGVDTTQKWDSDLKDEAKESATRRSLIGRHLSQLVDHVTAVVLAYHLALAQTPLTVDVIKSIHRAQMRGAADLKVGDWRDGFVTFSGKDGVPADRIAGKMEEVVVAFEERVGTDGIIIAAADLMHRMLRVHPFMDGNGRVARTLFAFALAREGFPFMVSFSSGANHPKDDYIKALRAADWGRYGLLTTTAFLSVVQAWRYYKAYLRP